MWVQNVEGKGLIHYVPPAPLLPRRTACGTTMRSAPEVAAPEHGMIRREARQAGYCRSCYETSEHE